jgi:hypothetical protein
LIIVFGFGIYFLFGIWDLGFGIFVNNVFLIIKQYPDRWGILIFVLPGPDRPDEGNEEADGYQETNGDKDKDDVH